jgi:phenylacetate-coenzyme A ligase PaaK-like adenylate-forming protein
MSVRDELKSALIHLNTDPRAFEALALDVFKYQYAHNEVYKRFADTLGKSPERIDRIEKIPFLPIEFFKSHTVTAFDAEPQIVFESSGTTSSTTSRHFVSDLALYEVLSRKTFEQMYGSLTDYHIFALLPSYLERNNSSLVYMVQNFIYYSYSQYSGFFLDNMTEMVNKMAEAAKDGRKILLIGVTFGLLDLAERLGEKVSAVSSQLTAHGSRLIVMETGGMKGRRKEMVREELHEILGNAFGVSSIHSEYGMTELLSQGYSKGDGLFYLPSSMKVLLREVNDPFTYLPHFAIGEKSEDVRQKTGGINVIDLANIDTCSFIETKDLGVYSDDYSGFRVVGRFDNSDVRGCNLLVS